VDRLGGDVDCIREQESLVEGRGEQESLVEGRLELMRALEEIEVRFVGFRDLGTQKRSRKVLMQSAICCFACWIQAPLP